MGISESYDPGNGDESMVRDVSMEMLRKRMRPRNVTEKSERMKGCRQPGL